jgi:hypothetical protein
MSVTLILNRNEKPRGRPAVQSVPGTQRVAEKHGLEGIVSKRRDAPYRSGNPRRCSRK